MLSRLLILGLAASLTSCATLPGRDNAPSSDAATLPTPKLEYTEFTLENGLRLIVHEDHRTPIVAVNVWYHVGSKNEPAGRSGFAHLFEHLMFNGSEHHRDEFFRPLEEVGATGANGTTNEDRTNYFANVPTPALDRLLWLESDRMGHLLGAITQEKLDEQRGVVKNEKRQRENEPYGRVWGLLPKLTYPAGHPYSWTTIGSMEDLDAATLDDVRDWFTTWYGAANATIVIAGDITPEAALERVTHYFGSIPSGPKLDRPERWEAPIPDRRRATLNDAVPQARIYRVYNVAANYTADLVDLQLATEVLGGGKSSRLYERLVWREQLATSVSAFVAPGEIGSQMYLIATLKPGVKPDQVEAILDAEVKRLRRNGATAAELERVRAGIYAQSMRGLERVGGFGGKSDQLASAAVLAGDPGFWAQELEWLRTTTPEQVRSTFRRWTDHGDLTLTVLPDQPFRTLDDSVDRSQLPQAGPAPALKFPTTQEKTLANGMRVIVARRENAPVTEYRWYAPGGQAADPVGREGLGTLTMDLLDEAAGGRDALELSRLLEGHGAQLSSSASLDHFSVSLSAVSGLEKVPLQIFADVLTRPELPAAELARRQALLLSRIRQEKAAPFSMGLRALPPLLFGADHPYGRPLTGSGTEDSVQAIDLAAVTTHAQRILQPAGSVLLIVGDLSLDSAIASLPPALTQWAGKGAPLPALELETVTTPSGRRIQLIDRPGAPQSVILAGTLIAPRSTPDNLALETLNALYGGLFTSRLNMNLREEKHWAYGAGSALVNTQAQRPWVVYTQVESAQTAASMREIVYEISRISQPGNVAAGELEHATRNRALKLPGQNETTGQLAGSLAAITLRNLPADHFDTLGARLAELQPTEITAAARAHLDNDTLQWVIVGDLSVIREDIEKLGWAVPEVLESTP